MSVQKFFTHRLAFSSFLSLAAVAISCGKQEQTANEQGLAVQRADGKFDYFWAYQNDTAMNGRPGVCLFVAPNVSRAGIQSDADTKVFLNNSRAIKVTIAGKTYSTDSYVSVRALDAAMNRREKELTGASVNKTSLATLNSWILVQNPRSQENNESIERMNIATELSGRPGSSDALGKNMELVSRYAVEEMIKTGETLGQACPQKETIVKKVGGSTAVAQGGSSSLDGKCRTNAEFSLVRSFAYSGSGLDLSSSGADAFAEDFTSKHRCGSLPEFKVRYEALKSFAYSSSYLDLTTSEAKAYAVGRASRISLKKLDEMKTSFSPVRNFFYASNFLDMSSSEASASVKKWIIGECPTGERFSVLSAEFTELTREKYALSYVSTKLQAKRLARAILLGETSRAPKVKLSNQCKVLLKSAL